MIIIDAIKHLDGEHVKQFIDTELEDIIIATNATMSFKLELHKETFIKDFLDADIEVSSKNDELYLINSDKSILKTSAGDYSWYHGSTRKINRLLTEIYGEPEQVEKPKRQTAKRLALAEKAEMMSQERIFAMMIGDDSDNITAFKGTGYQCLEWLNRQLVRNYDNVDNIKLHLNLKQDSQLSEFKTLAVLIEEGSLIL